jgi:hypothetical protein
MQIDRPSRLRVGGLQRLEDGEAYNHRRRHSALGCQAPAVYAAARTLTDCAPMSRCILRATGGPVDLDRYALRVGSRVDQVKRNVRAGVGE